MANFINFCQELSAIDSIMAGYYGFMFLLFHTKNTDILLISL